MKRIAWRSNERGVVLITALMVLLIMSLLGVTAMQTTTLEERMSNNFAQRELAFQASEAGLRDAEAFLRGMSITTLQGLSFTFTGTNGYFAPPTSGTPVWDSLDWTDNTKTIAYSATALAIVAAQPSYIVERLLPDRYIPPVGEDLPKYQMVFRITSRGVGANTTSVVMLQSTYLSPIF
jgi:type IV pilus assembly protein PilX